MKKNLLSISALDKKGFRVSFVDIEVLMWLKGKTIDDATIIGVEEGGIYKLKGHIDSTLTTITINPCEIWHRKLAPCKLQVIANCEKGCHRYTRDPGRS